MAMKKNPQNWMNPGMEEIKRYYLFLALAVVLVFGNTLFNGYNYDDNLVTINHPYTSKGLNAIGKIITSSYYSNQADIQFGYRPVVHLSFALEHQLFGQKPWISHAFNLFIYLGCVLLFFKLLAAWAGEVSLQFAFLIALLFAVHPVHSEAVASIKNRDELLAFLFVMVSFLQLNKFVSRQQWWRILVAILFFTVALLAKKSVYPLVFLIPPVLLFIHQQSSKTTLLISFLFSLITGAVAADLMPSRILQLVGAPLLFCLLVLAWVNRIWFINLFNQSKIRLFFSYVLMLITVVCTAAAIYCEDYTFFAVAMLPIIYLFLRKDTSSIVVLFTLICLLAVGYALQLYMINNIAFLIATLALTSQLANKKVDLALIVGFLLTAVAVLTRNPGFGVTILFLLVIAGCYFWDKRSWITIGLFLLIFIVSGLVFSLKYFHVVLFVLALVLALNTWLKKKNKTGINPQFMVLLLLLPILFFPKTSRTKLTNFWSGITVTEQLAKTSGQQNLSAAQVNASSDGRQLNYVENTLIGTQSREARFTTGIRTLGEYVRLMVFPYELNFYYGFAKIKTGSFSDFAFWFWLFFFTISGGTFIWLMAKNKLLFIGLIWFAGSILLFSNWVELVAGMVGERLAFTASAGFCLVIGSLLVQLVKKGTLSAKGLNYMMIGIVLVFSTRTIARNSNWKSQLTLVEHDIAHLTESVYANHMYALTCMNEATTNTKLSQNEKVLLIASAEQALKKATATYPAYFNAQFDLARLLIMQQNYAQAKVYLDKAHRLDSNNLFVLEELAKTCFDLNLPQETERYANAYLVQFPQNENMHEILAYTVFKQADYAKAKRYALRGLSYFPKGRNLNGLLADIEKELRSVKANSALQN